MTSLANTTLTTTTLSPYNPLNLGNTFVYTVLVLYTLILVVGLIGNGLTCAVVVLNKSMRRSIHFYTFNLALADGLLLLLYVPTQMRMVYDHLYWGMGDVMCSFCNFTIQLTLSASIVTLLAISIDRFRAIVDPFNWNSTSQRWSKIIIPVIWVISFALAFPVAYVARVVEHGRLDGQSFKICTEVWSTNIPSNNRQSMSYWTSMMLLQYLVPLVAIGFVNIRIVVQIKRSGDSVNNLHKRMLRMVILLLVTYTICTGMQHAIFFAIVFSEFSHQSIFFHTFVIANFVVTIQAAVNPFIYGTNRNDFKQAITGLFKYMFRRFGSSTLQNRNSDYRRFMTEYTNNTTTASSAMLTTPIMHRRHKDTLLQDDVTNNNTNRLTIPGVVRKPDKNDEEREKRYKRFSKRLESIAILLPRNLNGSEDFDSSSSYDNIAKFDTIKSTVHKDVSILTDSNKFTYNEITPDNQNNIPVIQISGSDNTNIDNNIDINELLDVVNDSPQKSSNVHFEFFEHKESDSVKATNRSKDQTQDETNEIPVSTSKFPNLCDFVPKKKSQSIPASEKRKRAVDTDSGIWTFDENLEFSLELLDDCKESYL